MLSRKTTVHVSNMHRIRWPMNLSTDDRVLQKLEEILCCFLPAIQENTSLKELDIRCHCGPSNLALVRFRISRAYGLGV